MRFKKPTLRRKQDAKTGEIVTGSGYVEHARTGSLNRWGLRVGIAVAVVALLAGFVVWRISNDEAVTGNSVVCDDKTLREASPLLNRIGLEDAKTTAAKQAQLKPIVEKIQATEDYSQDINCVYITTSYYVAIEDADKAKADFDKLAAIPKSLSPAFGPSPKSVEALRSQVEFLVKQKDAALKNVMLSPKFTE
jgi:hypothetical protein